MNLNQQANLIQSLGLWLQENQKGKVLTKEKEEKIIQDWGISPRVFERIFGDYRKTTPLSEKKFYPNRGKAQGKRVRDKATGKEYRSMQECADDTGQKIYILKQRLLSGKSERFEFVL
jgi:hypothetical protein